MNPRWKLAAVVLVQLVVLLSLVGFGQVLIWTSDTIVLKAQVIDPHSLLGTRYPYVQYDVSTLDPREVPMPDAPSGDVYVELRKGDDGYWDAVAVHESRTHSMEGTVLLKGFLTLRDPRSGTYEVRYDVESVYIPDSEAARLPSGSNHEIGVKVRVDRFGHATPLSFLIEGEPFELERR